MNKDIVLSIIFSVSILCCPIYFTLFYEQPVYRTVILEKLQTTWRDGTPRFFYITKDYGTKETDGEDFLKTKVNDLVDVTVREESSGYKSIIGMIISMMVFAFGLFTYKTIVED